MHPSKHNQASGNPVRFGGGCATVTGYKLPPCHWRRRCGTGKAGARLRPEVRISV